MGSLFDRITDLADEIGAWLDDTQDRAAELSDLIGDLLTDPAQVIGSIPQSLVDGLTSALGGKAAQSAVDAVNTFLLDLANAILSAIRGVPVVGGVIADRIEDVLDDIAALKGTADTAQSTAEAVQVGIVEGWQNGSTTGADLDVYDTMGAIRALVGGDGYTRVNITSTTTWARPTGLTEVITILISAGQGGAVGGYDGGAGGHGGGHKVQALNLGDFTDLYVELGTPGNPSRIRANNSGGTVLMDAYPGGAGSMATQFGYTGSNSQAGAGGAGGVGGVANGRSGEAGAQGGASAAALGGAGGSVAAAKP